MNYGYFDNSKREYVITDPRTPMPWANYLGSPAYGAIVTQNAGGYSFVKSGAAGRILRYSFNQFDEPGRYIYLRDQETGDFWSASWRPVEKSLDEYKTTIDGLFQMTDEQKNAWGVIGNICDTNWDTDFPMTEEPAGTYTSEVLELQAGEEFKVRQGASWDVNFGVEFNGANIVVEADGKYQVQLVWDGAQGGTVTLIPAE